MPGKAEGTVISSSPAADESVIVGSPVDLVTATGRVPIINYVGFTLQAATESIQGPSVGLTASRIEDPSCAATDPETVTQQSIPPGEAAVGSTIALTVCTGPAA